jgi:hypothetical protein
VTGTSTSMLSVIEVISVLPLGRDVSPGDRWVLTTLDQDIASGVGLIG